VSDLQTIGGDLEAALESVSVPTYVLDQTGVIRWLNPAAERLVGDVRGRQFTSVVAPEEARRAREHFVRNLVGTASHVDTEVVVLDAEGNRIGIEISAVRLMRGDHCIGVFGQVADVDEDHDDDPPHPDLTPRQAEVLRLLARGRSTEGIARELHLSVQTVRNHIRHVLRALGAHSRLEAVAIARRDHLVAVGPTTN
jgi:PAS domain S-box-containing protein